MVFRNILLTLSIFINMVLSAQQQDGISVQNLKANLEVLASDEFEGREAATRGDRLAQLFIVSELKKYGLKALSDYPDYRMTVDLVLTKVSEKSALILKDNIGAELTSIHFGEDLIAWSKYRSDTTFNLPLVFVGYGIQLAEKGWDDYADLDLKGKIVVIAPGVPKQLNPDNDPKIEEEISGSKIFAAYSKGAAGLILIADDKIEAEWSGLAKPAISLRSKVSTKNPGRAVFLMRSSAATKLVTGPQMSEADYLTKIAAGEKLPAFDLDVSVTFKIIASVENGYTTNIIGYIEGTDPDLKHEFVALGAHYDHLGMGRGDVFNGADDDGSGVVAILETARALTQVKNLKRSVLVVFHGAEEKGLLGSNFLSDNFRQMDKITAQINIDMVGREHIDTIYSVGSAKITADLKQIVEEVNAQTSKFVFNYQFDEPGDPHRIYERSDHYHYARKGIPIVFFYDFMNEDYHKATDDVDKINFEKIKKTSELIYHLTVRLGNLNERLKADQAN